jgi:two-component system, NarL family, sensor histidine kinase UhpB
MKQRLLIALWHLPLLLAAQIVCGQAIVKKDSLYTFALIQKAEDHLLSSRYDSALYYCNKAETYSKANNYRKGIAYSLIKKTEIYIDKDELGKADLYPKEINLLGQQINDSLVIAVSQLQMAQIKMYSNKIEEALALFEKCTKTYFEKHPSKYAALAYNDYGFTLGDKGDLLKQADNLIKALRIYEAVSPGDYGELAVTLNNISTVYYNLGNKDKAIEYAKRSILYREKDGDISKLALGCCNISQLYRGINDEESVKYQQLCVKYAVQSGDEDRIIQSYITSSLIASDQNDTKRSVEYELKVIELLEKSKKHPATLSRRYISAGMGFNTLKEDTASITYFTKAEELSKSINHKPNLRDVYYQLAIFYKNRNDFTKAYNYYTKHILYRDSLVNSTTAANIADLEKKYQTEKKDNEILQLNTAQRIKELQIEKQNALLAGNLLEAKKKQDEIELLSRAKELQELKITQQQEQLEKQILQAKNNEQQLQLAEKEKQLQQKQLEQSNTIRNFLLGGLGLLLILGYFLFNRYQLKRKLQEQEALLTVRNNIAKDLHDDIGASLSNINILNELAKRNASDSKKVNEYLERSGEDIQQVSESISDIVWNINPKFDNPENLFIRMKRYAADMLDGKNILYKMNFPCNSDIAVINMEQRRDVYMIFKEAVNNLAKYSGAANASIDFEIAQQQIKMTIADNGKGFSSTGNKQGNGLHNMKQRAEKWKGSLQVNSSNGNGTSIVVNMPMAK